MVPILIENLSKKSRCHVTNSQMTPRSQSAHWRIYQSFWWSNVSQNSLLRTVTKMLSRHVFFVVYCKIIMLLN